MPAVMEVADSTKKAAAYVKTQISRACHPASAEALTRTMDNICCCILHTVIVWEVSGQSNVDLKTGPEKFAADQAIEYQIPNN